jgi:hypothetical protein
VSTLALEGAASHQGVADGSTRAVIAICSFNRQVTLLGVERYEVETLSDFCKE